MDAIADGSSVKICGILQHVEYAGVHSGDSACFYPDQLSPELKNKIIEIVTNLALSLKIIGFINVQFAIKESDIYVLEVNPRASRTVPFLSKTTLIPWARLATLCMLGHKLDSLTIPAPHLMHAVKESTFPFNKLYGVSLALGPEMKSTGEVMSSGLDPKMAFLKAQFATGFKLNIKPNNFVIINYLNPMLDFLLDDIKKLKLQIIIYRDNNWCTETNQIISPDDIKQLFKDEKVALVLNLASNDSQLWLFDLVLLFQCAYVTTTEAAQLLLAALNDHAIMPKISPTLQECVDATRREQSNLYGFTDRRLLTLNH